MSILKKKLKWRFEPGFAQDFMLVGKVLISSPLDRIHLLDFFEVVALSRWKPSRCLIGGDISTIKFVRRLCHWSFPFWSFVASLLLCT